MLNFIFIKILYPITIFFLFGCIFYIILITIKRQNNKNRIRLIVATVLPLIILIFSLIPTENTTNSIKDLFSSLKPLYRFIIGAITGFIILELGNFFCKKDTEIGIALYVLFLSIINTFILYSIIEGMLNSLHILLLGIIVTGCIHVIFKGIPEFTNSKI